MPSPDWRSGRGYEDVAAGGRRGLAWEFLRRNPDYIAEVGDGSDVGALMKATASSLGGCDFAADPLMSWRSASVFWRPDVAADVVSFASSPANFSGGPTVADLQRLAVVVRHASDGLHMLWDDGTQLWVAGDLRSEQPLVALLPFDEPRGRRTISGRPM